MKIKLTDEQMQRVLMAIEDGADGICTLWHTIEPNFDSKGKGEITAKDYCVDRVQLDEIMRCDLANSSFDKLSDRRNAWACIGPSSCDSEECSCVADPMELVAAREDKQLTEGLELASNIVAAANGYTKEAEPGRAIMKIKLTDEQMQSVLSSIADGVDGLFTLWHTIEPNWDEISEKELSDYHVSKDQLVKIIQHDLERYPQSELQSRLLMWEKIGPRACDSKACDRTVDSKVLVIGDEDKEIIECLTLASKLDPTELCSEDERDMVKLGRRMGKPLGGMLSMAAMLGVDVSSTMLGNRQIPRDKLWKPKDCMMCGEPCVSGGCFCSIKCRREYKPKAVHGPRKLSRSKRKKQKGNKCKS